MKAGAVETWLAARTPRRPKALAAQMSAALAACPPARLDAAPTMAGALGMLGLRVLAGVAAEGHGDPNLQAMELLSADAFVTYAFEAAAEEGVSVAPFVAWLVREAA